MPASHCFHACFNLNPETLLCRTHRYHSLIAVALPRFESFRPSQVLFIEFWLANNWRSFSPRCKSKLPSHAPPLTSRDARRRRSLSHGFVLRISVSFIGRFKLVLQKYLLYTMHFSDVFQESYACIRISTRTWRGPEPCRRYPGTIQLLYHAMQPRCE
jgi:hypothetical protein